MWISHRVGRIESQGLEMTVAPTLLSKAVVSAVQSCDKSTEVLDQRSSSGNVSSVNFR